MSDISKLSGIDLESLPEKEISVFTLRGSIERGVKSVIRPWQVAKELDDPGDHSLQAAYETRVKELTDGILEIVVNEIYLEP